MEIAEAIRSFRVPPDARISLRKDHDPGYTGDFVKKKHAQGLLQKGIEHLAIYQDMLYAQDTYALLLIFQAMDAAGKDGTIKHVMSGINPQGCDVSSFKSPSSEELNHDYLWRCSKRLPERGRIGIFNRSYYEEVLVARVHPEILEAQRLPPEVRGKDIWKRRFDAINGFERHLVANGIIVLKFFLNVSKKEQKRRFLDRIDRPAKNWKFSASDVKERAFWDAYMQAYKDVFNHTSTQWAPWYIIPADHKWFTRVAVATVIVDALKSLKLRYPTVSKEHKQTLLQAREILNEED